MKKKSHQLSFDQESDLLLWQIDIIKTAIRSLIYFRNLDSTITLKSAFWMSTKNSHFQTFVTSWSKLFGNRGEDTHWNKIFVGRAEFKKHLKRHFDRESARKLSDYTKTILVLRNKVFSHTDTKLGVVKIPSLNRAYEFLVFIFEKIIKRLAELPIVCVVKPADVRMWTTNLDGEAGKLIEIAYASTSNFEEHHG